ncbi:MAG: hypothetical protein H6750_06645 [Nitrospiraceae bacterium]|nr:hypothetical protein [Nitrospiraceae bacterium]
MKKTPSRHNPARKKPSSWIPKSRTSRSRPAEKQLHKYYIYGEEVSITLNASNTWMNTASRHRNPCATIPRKRCQEIITPASTPFKRWNSSTDRKEAIIEELERERPPLEPLAEEVRKELDPFDLICHVAL